MKIAIPLYPRFTAMDVIGPYEVLARLPDTEVVFVAEHPGPVTNDLASLTIDVSVSLTDLERPDIVLIGGGPGQAEQMADGLLHEWLRNADRTCAWMTSVCTGSLILAAAGLLEGRSATSHWCALDQLAKLGVTPTKQRVVFDGHYATAAGISAGIDLALTLAGKVAGDDAAQSVQLIIEYAPEPPYDAGSLDTAPANVVEATRQRLANRFPDT